MHEAGDVAPWAGKAAHETASNGIADQNEYDRYRGRFPLQCLNAGVSNHDDHVRGRGHHFARVGLPLPNVAIRKKVDADVAAIVPTELPETLPERLNPCERLGICGAAR